MTYSQLSYDQRLQLATLLKEGYSQRRTARIIGVHPSTISRELKRNKGQRGYRYKQAHRQATERRKKAAKHVRLTESLKRQIVFLLEQGWSPEQISGRLRTKGRAWVSHETIYQFIYADQARGGSLHRFLRRHRKKRRKRLKHRDRRGRIKDQTSIDQRPAIVDQKARVGDWEIDTVFGRGRKGALVTMVERKTKMTSIAYVTAARADLVAEAIVQALLPYRDLVHTLTSDNGKEFALHKSIAEALGAQFFSAHPYSSWERGFNENTNGLIRQYFPKNAPLGTVDTWKLIEVQTRLNTRPRKSLGFATPVELFYNARVALGT